MSTADSLETTATLPPVALIAGPTASGKSDVAVLLAQAWQARGRLAVIVNADSAQVYADLQVLSARPSAEEMGGIEHRLFGTWDGSMACSAADWAAQAKAEIADIHAQGGLPILVGGTGLYLHTLLDGIAPVPPIDPQVREAVRALETPAAYAALRREDPQRAAALAPADSTRISRALEVVRSTGRSLAAWQEERLGGIGAQIALHPLILLPERAELYARCDLRFTRMLERGAIDEVRALLARNLDPALPVMRAIGVRDIAGYHGGEYGFDEAIARGSQATRNYAKRQFTWFRNQPPQDWPRIPRNPDNIAKQFEILFHTLQLT